MKKSEVRELYQEVKRRKKRQPQRKKTQAPINQSGCGVCGKNIVRRDK
ncbi:MAG: hypothetical protein LPK26_03175 [Bacillaceae bacterium]|nr:hypothetical protein [Bacillaceae bacterium]